MVFVRTLFVAHILNSLQIVVVYRFCGSQHENTFGESNVYTTNWPDFIHTANKIGKRHDSNYKSGCFMESYRIQSGFAIGHFCDGLENELDGRKLTSSGCCCRCLFVSWKREFCGNFLPSLANSPGPFHQHEKFMVDMNEMKCFRVEKLGPA